MTHSPTIQKIATALHAVQRRLKAAQRSKTNETYDHDYSTLEDVIHVLRAPCSTNGLSYVQSVECVRGDVFENATLHQARVRTLILHTSGEWIETDCSAPSLPHSDQHAAECTKLRRRALAAAFGVRQADSDGASAREPEDVRDAADYLFAKYGADEPRMRVALVTLSHAQKLVLLRKGLSSDALIEAARTMQEGQ